MLMLTVVKETCMSGMADIISQWKDKADDADFLMYILQVHTFMIMKFFSPGHKL
jgi:hypothetical protein